MNNKFETEKERKKLLSISLIEHFYKNTLDWISVKALYPFSYALYLSFPIIKARLKKHFFHSFAKKKFIPVRSFVSNFKTYLEIQMYCVKSKRRYFWCAPPPSPRKEPLQTIPHLRARRAGLVPEVARGGGGDNRSNWTMRALRQSWLLSVLFFQSIYIVESVVILVKSSWSDSLHFATWVDEIFLNVRNFSVLTWN